MIDVAVVGAGAWGKNHIRVFSELPNVRLKYICDAGFLKAGTDEKGFSSVYGYRLFRIRPGRPRSKRVVIASSAISHAPLPRRH